MKYGRINELRRQHPVAAMCRVLDVSESGYYAWRKRPRSPRAQKNAQLETQIKAAHERTRQTYGPERLQADLADNGIQVGIHRIRRIRKKLGLTLQAETQVQGDDGLESCPAGRTEPSGSAVCRCCAEQSLGNRHHLHRHRRRLALPCGHQGFVQRRARWLCYGRTHDAEAGDAGAVRGSGHETSWERASHHSDRGSQYCAHAYQKLLREFGMQASMSRKGNCWDNAPMESCWGCLKTELIHQRRFATREQAKREITEYIEIFYNRIRKQARLGHLSPAAFCQQYYAIQMAA